MVDCSLSMGDGRVDWLRNIEGVLTLHNISMILKKNGEHLEVSDCRFSF